MKVELVSKTVGQGKYENLSNEEIIAAVARHGKIKDDNGKLVTYLMEHKHVSPLEHIFFSFNVVTSRAMSAQIFRHWSMHFQETSQRYEKIASIENIEFRTQAVKNRQSSLDVVGKINFESGKIDSGKTTTQSQIDAIVRAKRAVVEIQAAYNDLIDADIAKECARFILPMASTTVIHISGTFRDLLAFLNLRMDSHAQKEVKLIATQMGEALEKEMPNVMGAIDWRNGMFL